MKIKHKLLADYQYVSEDKKIFLIKSGSILEDYVHSLKGEKIKIDRELVENNPDLFQLIDWKAELVTFMRSEKMPQPAQLGKKLIPFLEELVFSSIERGSETQTPVDTREIELKEMELSSRERRVKDVEYENEIRTQRLDKREDEYKSEMKALIEKEDDLRRQSRQLTEKKIDLESIEKKLTDRERNIEKEILKNSEDFDSKYKDMNDKISKDYKNLEDKEKELKEKEAVLNKSSAELEDLKNLKSDFEKEKKALIDEILSIESDVRNISRINQSLANSGHPLFERVYMELSSAISSLQNRVDNNSVK